MAAEATLNPKKGHLAVLEAFEGFIQSTILEKQELFAATLPDLLNEVKQGKHSPKLIRAFILEKLTGGKLKVLKCGNCGVRFYVDKPPSNIVGYHCPACGTSYSITENEDESAILKAALARFAPKVATPTTEAQKPPILKIIPIVKTRNNIKK